MFADCLIESAAHPNPRRRWTTLLSIALQSLALAVAIIVPMLFTQTTTVKALAATGMTYEPVLSKPPEIKTHTSSVSPNTEAAKPSEMVIPEKIPDTINTTPDSQSVTPSAPSDNIHGNNNPRTSSDTATMSSIDTGHVTKPVEPIREEHHGPIRISDVGLGELKYRVQPVYPAICRQVHCQGQVIMHAIISKQGTIEQLEVVNNANPMLIQSALQAVRLWRYKPYLLNGEPVEVETQITVNFTMGNQ
jgi:protein TonB